MSDWYPVATAQDDWICRLHLLADIVYSPILTGRVFIAKPVVDCSSGMISKSLIEASDKFTKGKATGITRLWDWNAGYVHALEKIPGNPAGPGVDAGTAS